MYNQTVYLKINCFAKIQTYEQNSSKLSEIFDAYTNRSLHFQLSLSLSRTHTHTHFLSISHSASFGTLKADTPSRQQTSKKIPN